MTKKLSKPKGITLPDDNGIWWGIMFVGVAIICYLLDSNRDNKPQDFPLVLDYIDRGEYNLALELLKKMPQSNLDVMKQTARCYHYMSNGDKRVSELISKCLKIQPKDMECLFIFARYLYEVREYLNSLYQLRQIKTEDLSSENDDYHTFLQALSYRKLEDRDSYNEMLQKLKDKNNESSREYIERLQKGE